MKVKGIVRHITSDLKDRKEIFKIAYCRGSSSGKKIEAWLNTELLAELIKLKNNGKLDEVEGEHQYNFEKRRKPRRRFEHCDLWWKNKEKEHWLEVKTMRHTSNSVGLKKSDVNMITSDLEKMNRLKPPYSFHHLLVVLDDDQHNNGNWKSDIYSIYQDKEMTKTDKWDFRLNDARNVIFFLHSKSVLD